MKRLGVYAFLLLATASIWINPEAQATTSYVEAKSGASIAGGRDTSNKISIDNGVTYFNAYVLDPLPAPLQGLYPTIAGTKWISGDPDGLYGNPGNLTRVQILFNMPLSTLPSEFKIRLHADNYAYVYLNGVSIGGQQNCECYANYDDPPTVFTTTNTSLFHQTNNLLQIDFYNWTQYTALDYKASVTY